MTSHAFHLTDRRRSLPIVLIATGLVLLLAAGAWQLVEARWMSNYHRVGMSLTQLEESRIDAAHGGASIAGTADGGSPTGSGARAAATLDSKPRGSGAASSACPQQSTSGPQGLLKFPELDVVAPVEQGSDDSVLAVAVGHDPASVWPGTNGTAVLLSHDVTYFVNIGHLKQNDVVNYSNPCGTYTYKVTGSKVVTAGTTIYNSPGSTIDLVTCYPSNALFYTNQRLVVSLGLVKRNIAKTAHPLSISNRVPTINARQPTVPVPAQLSSQGLTLASNYAPMGTLTILGTPTSRYVQSPAALLAQNAALVAYFGGIKSLAQGHLDWWSKFAPNVRPPSALVGHSINGYTSSVNVYIQASNASIHGVVIRDGVRLGSSSYSMQINMAISPKNVLTITSWKL